MNMPDHLENFFLSDDFLASVEIEEIDATLRSMHECGIDRVPFDNFYLTITWAAMINNICDLYVEGGDDEAENDDLRADAKNKNAVVQIECRNCRGCVNDTDFRIDMTITEKRAGGREIDYEELLDSIAKYDPSISRAVGLTLSSMATDLVRTLVVALATRGVTKDKLPEKQSKLAKLGIGRPRKPKPYAYTTTISMRGVKLQADDSGHAPTGLMRRPHLRRGHARDQHFGPDRSFIKKIFIEPVFVNSDRQFVSLRDHYNVSLKPKEKV